MTACMIVAVCIVVLLACWVLMIAPARRLPDTAIQMKKYIYAHRGLHSKARKIPENSMSAFDAAIKRGYGIELDVHLTRDGAVAVIHDRSLKRTVGADINIDDIDAADTDIYHLLPTSAPIPMLTAVLCEVKGQVPLLIELKVDDGNHAALCEATLKALEGYRGAWALQSFDPRVLVYLKKHHPHVLRGQLAGYLRKGGTRISPVTDMIMRNLLTNCVTKPHFISYRIHDAHKPSISLCRALYKPMEFNWTLRKKEDHDAAKHHGGIPIFEKYIP